jgi:hypothetical protein
MSAPKRDSFGALAGLLTAIVGGVFWDAGDNETVGAPLVIGGLVLMAASYASGGIGYYRVKNCRKAIVEFEQRAPAAAPSPEPPPPPSREPPPASPGG